jgi:hypothetical protein
MTGPVGPVRSESDHFRPGKLVRPIRFVCKDNRTGPIPRTTRRTTAYQPVRAPYTDSFNSPSGHL